MGGKLQAKCNFVFVIEIIYWGHIVFMNIFNNHNSKSVNCKL